MTETPAMAKLNALITEAESTLWKLYGYRRLLRREESLARKQARAAARKAARAADPAAASHASYLSAKVERNRQLVADRAATPQPTLKALALRYGISADRVRQILAREDARRSPA